MSKFQAIGIIFILIFAIAYHSTYAQTSNVVLSPLKQFKTGISLQEVKCNQGLVLITKTSDNSPACVKSDTAQKLVERGWGIMISLAISEQNNSTQSNMIKVSNANFTINYEITGGKVIGIIQDTMSKSVIISVKTTSHGKLTITIPRALFDVTLNDHDDKFFILVDGQYTDYTEIKTTATDRTVIIPFNKGTEEIEFTGTFLLSGH